MLQNAFTLVDCELDKFWPCANIHFILDKAYTIHTGEERINPQLQGNNCETRNNKQRMVI